MLRSIYTHIEELPGEGSSYLPLILASLALRYQDRRGNQHVYDEASSQMTLHVYSGSLHLQERPEVVQAWLLRLHRERWQSITVT